MERRGVYRKGSAHHPRNINPYLLYRQHVKKWRLPMTVIVVLLLVFGVAPRVGDNFQTSVLSSEKNVASNAFQSSADAFQSSADLRKTLMNGVKTMVSECDRFAMTQCKEDGSALLEKLSQADRSPEQLHEAVTGFIAQFQSHLAWNSCKFDLGEVVVTSRSLAKKADQFVERYGTVIETPEALEQIKNFTAALDALELFVDGCEAR